MAQAAGYRTPRFLTFRQALELGGHVRKGERGTKVYFVKQLQVADRDGEEGDMRIVPMMREYCVWNVDQCEGLPEKIVNPIAVAPKRGLSQERLAFDSGVDRSYVGGLERREENPTVDVLDRLARTLSVHISEFFVQPAKGSSPPKPLRSGRRPSRYPNTGGNRRATDRAPRRR
jgi:DNA-binding XRE family transcriptional regulator